MGQRFFWLWLLLWSLLCLYVQGFPVRRAKRTNENTEHVHISMHPTEIVHLSVDKKEEHGKIEENILDKLVVLLKNTVEKIPTQRPSDKPVITYNLQSSPSVTVDTLWINHKPKNSEVQTQASQTDSSTDEIAKTTTPFWRLRNDSVATIILHTETTPMKTMPERLQSKSRATTVVYSDKTVSETPTVTASLLLEKISTIGEKSKTSNQLTKGTLSNLVESLKNMDKLHDMLHEPSDNSQQEGNREGHMEGHQHKPEAADNLKVIDTVVKTIRNSPRSVKNDPALHNNVEEAKRLLQADLKLVGEAEKRLKEAKDHEEKERQTSPSPLPDLAGSEITILLMSVSSGQEKQEKEREQQTSPSPPPHLTVSVSEATLLVPVPPDLEDNKREQQISLSPSPHFTVSDATILLAPASSDQKEENKQDQQISPSPPTHLTVSDVTVQLTTVSSNSLAKKAEETQVKNGEFKSLIKLLYGFNGHAENTPNKKVARDIVNKTIAALDAINTISSGKADKNKKMLQQWLKKDMALPRKAIWKS